jgi:hypothetical protein
MRFRVEAFIAVLILAGCSSAGSGSSVPQAAGAALSAARPESVSSGPVLYAFQGGNKGIAVVRTSDGKVLRSITSGVRGASALAVDASGTLYVGNARTMALYKEGASAPSEIITDGIDRPNAIVVAPNGDVLVANRAGVVHAYAPAGGAPAYTLHSSVSGVTSLATDASGDVYVGNSATDSVKIYASGGPSLVRTIADGIHQPVALKVDTAGDLYVSNQGIKMNNRSQPGFITVYKPGATTVSYRVPGGGAAIATDDADNLYVVSNGQAPGGNLGAAYKSGSATPSYIIGNVAPSDRYTCMIAGPSGAMYVVDLTAYQVLPFAPHATSFHFWRPGVNGILLALSP